ncbi:MAG: LemA family protein [Crocinitomicaceae bacterium]|nr:LemA family protein [Crocinitomicaceae bacterium]MDG1658253.1 LemA family protein [Crocinitomicaceae bacterium]MDG2441072.1 LemA family protein [Crocinitomicaceae bacterium]|tara:strand:+ start:1918 stop:2478 length:561 start_codon:yes stop_codon:yes gene_type:complete
MIWIIVGVVVFILLVMIIINNSLVSRKNQVDNAFASIDVYLKKRSDLIPQLVDTVKGYMKHEKEVLTEITRLRTAAQSNEFGSNDRVVIENDITAGLGKIAIAVENYPDLKAGENYLMLQRSINEVEEQLSASRRAFNASVTDYNNGVESIPSNIIAGMKGYKLKNVFTIPSESRPAMEERPDTTF